MDQPRNEGLEDQLEALFPDSWRFRYRWYRPVERLPPGAPPPEWRAEILGGLRRRLTAMGTRARISSTHFRTAGCGSRRAWLPVSAWAREGEQIRIQSIKEKLGTLWCYVYGSARLERLCRWAQCQSEERCMATGMPGETRVEYGRVLTLSDEMYVLFERDPAGLQDRMYRA